MFNSLRYVKYVITRYYTDDGMNHKRSSDNHTVWSSEDLLLAPSSYLISIYLPTWLSRLRKQILLETYLNPHFIDFDASIAKNKGFLIRLKQYTFWIIISREDIATTIREVYSNFTVWKKKLSDKYNLPKSKFKTIFVLNFFTYINY